MTGKQIVTLATVAVAMAASATAALSTASANDRAGSLEIQSSAFAEGVKFPAADAIFTPPIDGFRGHKLSGEVVYVGRGCPRSLDGLFPEDPYLANPSGKVALIERGFCEFDSKIARAQLAGAVGAIVHNNVGGDVVLEMGGASPVTLPDGPTVEISIPAVGIAESVGLQLRNGTPPVRAQVKAKNR
jgi:hypothetical protein